MSEKKNEEIEFIKKPSFQSAIIKTRRKQMIKYFMITMFTTVLLLTIIYFGSQQILENRAVDNKSMNYSLIQGANIIQTSEIPKFDLFSVTLENTYSKDMGDRYILWDIQKETIPLFGEKKMRKLLNQRLKNLVIKIIVT